MNALTIALVAYLILMFGIWAWGMYTIWKHPPRLPSPPRRCPCCGRRE